MSLATWVGVALLGGVGATLRFLVDAVVSGRAGRAFPLGTLAVNLSGAVALGFVAGLAVPETASVLAGTAAIGAYTTFSTWMLETQRLTEDGEADRALVNALLSLALGLGAVALGRSIGAHW